MTCIHVYVTIRLCQIHSSNTPDSALTRNGLHWNFFSSKEPESHDETEAESVFPNDNRALQLQTRLGTPSIRSSRASLRSRESRNSRLRRMTASQEVNLIDLIFGTKTNLYKDLRPNIKRPRSFPYKQSQLIPMIHFEFSSMQSIGSSKTSRDPERMYKIVLAGDAAVGKSSFIMRLCKGKFVPNLSSTLGTDTQI